jgi:hypothetical protein
MWVTYAIAIKTLQAGQNCVSQEMIVTAVTSYIPNGLARVVVWLILLVERIPVLEIVVATGVAGKLQEQKQTELVRSVFHSLVSPVTQVPTAVALRVRVRMAVQVLALLRYQPSRQAMAADVPLQLTAAA